MITVPEQSVLCRGCLTKYLGPTNTKSARVKATHLATRRSVTLSYDYGLEAFENHALAAHTLFARENEWGRYHHASVETGWVFLLEPHDPSTSGNPKESNQ